MKYNEVYSILRDLCAKQIKETGKLNGFSTEEIAKVLNMKRENVSREFGRLLKDGLIEKSEGRPVLYFVRKDNNAGADAISEKKPTEASNVFENIVGKNNSLKHSIALAKAAIVYPPRGLHTLIVGETGVGKSFFANCMFKYALEVNVIKDSNRFVVFNCADYSSNPQLLMGHLFGVKRGAYTGALEDREGIIERARDGILFLDEVHRLPPEGQEMLFTLIDEGRYTPLGSTKEINIDVMIISATTENINSALLKTFSRRIPVTISLPPLRERTEEERLALVENFFKEEQIRVGKKIEVDNEAITALLNFECPNNIGELKSDIQIACAKAFLRSMFTDLTVKINLEDFSEKVRAGLLKAKKVTGSNFKVESKGQEYKAEEVGDKYTLSANIYEFMEERSKHLKSKGLEQDEIRLKVSNEVENFINTYLASIEGKRGEDDIKHIVSTELYDFLNNFMYLAEYRLKRKVSRNTFLGLLVHIDAFLGRARERRLIENPKLDEIRKQYPDEFKLAMLLAEKLEQKYEVTVPLDEMGFITMFFAADVEEKGGRVAVIVVMHGNSTASSMAEVVNQLLNTSHTLAFDMPLSMKPETALVRLKSIVREYDEGMGVLLLVDMGSLKYFDKLIKDETGIEVMAVDRVTTVMVLEATRKALMNQNLDEIIKSLDFDSRYLGNHVEDNIKSQKDVIITACSTGEGTAQKLKELIYTKYSKEQYEVVNLSIKDREKFKKTVMDIKNERNIKSIISSFEIKIPGIDYIPMDKFLKELMGEDFEANIEDEELIKNIKIVYSEYLDLEDPEFIVNTFMELTYTMKYTFDIHLDSEKLNGLLMHFGCLIQNLINKEERAKCKNKDIILSRYSDLYDYIKNGVNGIEKRYDIEFTEDDTANIVEILINL